MRGAAIATVISQAASAAFVILFLFGKRVQVPITFGGYDLRVMGRVLVMGFTPFLIVAVDNVMIIAMNAILQRTGGADGDMLVTCNTIVQSFMLVVTMPLGGISGGTQGILGFNYGARQVDRVRQAQKYIVGLCVGYTALLFVLARVAGPLFVRLFTQDPELAQEAFDAIKVCTLAIIPLGFPGRSGAGRIVVIVDDLPIVRARRNDTRCPGWKNQSHRPSAPPRLCPAGRKGRTLPLG